MNRIIMFFSLLLSFFDVKTQIPAYDAYPVYTGNDLGLTYHPGNSTFKIWSPTSERSQLLFYKEGIGGEAISINEMQQSINGTWTSVISDNIIGQFYVFRVMIGGQWLQEVPDPYAKAVGINGRRARVVNMHQTNPVNWEKDKSPVFKNKTDAILYELHIRDASIADNSGIKHKGKYLGLTESGTKNPDGYSTGLDHIRKLGVTHVHLLPVYDFYSLDESKTEKPQYNWGYDPLNYNTPDGFYSTNAADGISRIKEFKKLVQSLHQNGLRVVMDVVYNHTRLTEGSYFNQLVPGYYYRQTIDGKFSNATACGNETASERAMMRKFMVESMLYWVNEYHIDGFRVDLMGVHDIETMNLISRELHKIKPDILIYGEGWTADSSPLPDSLRALKKYVYKLDKIAVFSDDIRDGIKGSVFEHEEKGFASGKPGMEESIKFGVVAACKHPQVDYSKVKYSKAAFANEPFQTITYAECHDNHVLWDKLNISTKDASENERKEMYKLALSIVLTSQGIPFLHAGTEFLRSKKGVENSFESPDSINAIDWNLKSKNIDVYEYVKELIHIRKSHPAFRMKTGNEIATHIQFIENLSDGIVAYHINGAAVGDSWKNIFVILNGSGKERHIPLSKGTWTISIFNNRKANNNKAEGSFTVTPYSCAVLYQ